MALTKSDLTKIGDLLDKQEQKFEGKLVEFKSDFFEKIDPVLKEVAASREERTVLAEQITRHEDRITVIEEKLQIKSSLAV